MSQDKTTPLRELRGGVVLVMSRAVRKTHGVMFSPSVSGRQKL